MSQFYKIPHSAVNHSVKKDRVDTQISNTCGLSSQNPHPKFLNAIDPCIRGTLIEHLMTPHVFIRDGGVSVHRSCPRC